jgi:hypothetical protein
MRQAAVHVHRGSDDGELGHDEGEAEGNQRSRLLIQLEGGRWIRR